MIIFPRMLVPAAQKAGITMPDDLENYEPTEYPHWHMLCLTQLQRAMRHGEHWENAQALVQIPADKLLAAQTWEELRPILDEAGVGHGI